jgi:hypothetical protein
MLPLDFTIPFSYSHRDTAQCDDSQDDGDDQADVVGGHTASGFNGTPAAIARWIPVDSP